MKMGRRRRGGHTPVVHFSLVGDMVSHIDIDCLSLVNRYSLYVLALF